MSLSRKDSGEAASSDNPRPVKPPPPRLQGVAGGPLPRTLRETYAEALKSAELEYRAAQAALGGDDSDQARARYARALAEYDKLQAQFPFIAAGAGDVEV